MLCSRVCWQLLLGWALLLGQPVFGDSDTAEEPTLAESEEPVPELQEPVPESQEELVPESQDPEGPVPGSQELEEQGPGEPVASTLDEGPGRLLSYEDMQMLFGPSEDELEMRAQDDKERVERIRDDPFDYSSHYLKGIALQHYNQKSKYVYTPYENGNVKLKKAIGSMIYIKFLMVKTSCTKEEGEALLKQLRIYEEDLVPTEMKHCEVPPASEQEIEECTFTLFQDAREYHWPRYTVVDHRCEPFNLRRENRD